MLLFLIFVTHGCGDIEIEQLLEDYVSELPKLGL